MAADDTSQEVEALTTQDMDASAQEPIQEQTEEPTESVEQESEEVDSSQVKSQRGQQRVDELARERNAYAEENRTLKEQLYGKQEPEPVDYLKEIENFDPQLTGDYATDMRLIEERATERALAKLTERQSKVEQLSSDVRELERAYPELRNEPNNPNYDPDLSNEIVALYRESAKSNPDLRLKPFVERVMRVRAKAVSTGKEQSVSEIMAQEQSGAITPSSKTQSTPREPKDMSLDELESMIGFAE